MSINHLVIAVALIAGMWGIHLGFNRSWKGLLFAVFILQYEGGGTPPLGWVKINVFYVLGYGLGRMIKLLIYKRTKALQTPGRLWLRIVLVLSVTSLCLSLNTNKHVYLTSEFCQVALMPSILGYWTALLAAMLLFIFVCEDVRDNEKMLDLLWAFALSSFYMAITYFGSFILKINMGPFLNTIYSGGDSTNINFAGYTGGSGLIAEYCVAVIGAFIILLISDMRRLSRRAISILGIIICFFMLLSTTSRVGLLSLGLFIFGLIVLTFVIRKKLSSNLFIVIVLIMSLSGIMVLNITGEVMYKFDSALTNYQFGGIDRQRGIDRLLNRSYSTVSEMLELTGPFGVGAMYGPELLGNNMVSHSMYVGIPVKVGWMGALAYLMFYLFVLRKLGQSFLHLGRLKSLSLVGVQLYQEECVSMNAHEKADNKRYAIGVLIVVFVCLFINEGFHNYENHASSMLMFWFLLALGASSPRWGYN